MNHLFYLVAHLGGQVTVGALSKIAAVEAAQALSRKILEIEVVTVQPYRFERSKHACMVLTVHADMSLAPVYEQKELRSSGKPRRGVLWSSMLLLRGRGLNCY